MLDYVFLNQALQGVGVGEELFASTTKQGCLAHLRGQGSRHFTCLLKIP